MTYAIHGTRPLLSMMVLPDTPPPPHTGLLQLFHLSLSPQQQLSTSRAASCCWRKLKLWLSFDSCYTWHYPCSRLLQPFHHLNVNVRYKESKEWEKCFSADRRKSLNYDYAYGARAWVYCIFINIDRYLSCSWQICTIYASKSALLFFTINIFPIQASKGYESCDQLILKVRETATSPRL